MCPSVRQNAALEVLGLTVSYSGKKAFDKISFSVSPQQIVGIIGPNGAGKTTLIKAIMGLLPTDTGTVRVLNKPVSKVRKYIAYVPQRAAIDLDFPVLVEDVVLMGRYPHLSWWAIPGAAEKKAVYESLKQVGMYGLRRKTIGELSGGQQQRVFLARALAQEAKLFFLDEPFAGIDITSENMIMQVLKELCDQGKTIFVVHHDLAKAEKYFNLLILLKNRLIAFGRPDEVFQVEALREAYGGRVAAVPEGAGVMVVNG